MPETEKPDLTTLTVQLLSAYLGNNSVPSGDIAELIRTTKAALGDEKQPAAPEEPEYVPAVSVKASTASKDHIISLIDGKPYKSLKRHLSVKGLTPEEYRARYNLPSNYPMVAPNYSAQRRAVAQQLGLGRKKSSNMAVGAVPTEAPKPASRPKNAAASGSGAKQSSKAPKAARKTETQPAE